MNITKIAKISYNEMDACSKVVAMLDTLIRQLDDINAKEIITLNGNTYDIDFINKVADMIFELMDGVEFN